MTAKESMTLAHMQKMCADRMLNIEAEQRSQRNDMQEMRDIIVKKLDNGITTGLQELVAAFKKHIKDHEAGSKRAQAHEKWMVETTLQKKGLRLKWFLAITGSVVTIGTFFLEKMHLTDILPWL